MDGCTPLKGEEIKKEKWWMQMSIFFSYIILDVGIKIEINFFLNSTLM